MAIKCGDFDLDNFLKNYKPKEDLKTYLAPYMKHKKLINYKLVEKNNRDEILPSKTYIKYIDIDDAKDGEKFRSSHIKSGGFLLGCGKLIGNKFICLDDPKEWKIMKLKFDPSAFVDEKGKVKKRIDPLVFFINLSKNYVFFRVFQNGMRDMMKNIEIELVNTKGKVIK